MIIRQNDKFRPKAGPNFRTFQFDKMIIRQNDKFSETVQKMTAPQARKFWVFLVFLEGKQSFCLMFLVSHPAPHCPQTGSKFCTFLFDKMIIRQNDKLVELSGKNVCDSTKWYCHLPATPLYFKINIMGLFTTGDNDDALNTWQGFCSKSCCT